MAERTKCEIRAEDVQGVKYLRKLGPLLSALRKVGTEHDRAYGTVIETLQRVAKLSWTPKAAGKHLSAYRLHTHFEVLSGKAVRIDATSANPRGEADVRAVLQRTIEADRCYILDRGSISYGLWNAINAVEIQAYCAVIVCVLILIYTGEKPSRSMRNMVWYHLIDLASRKELEAFIRKRKQPALA